MKPATRLLFLKSGDLNVGALPCRLTEEHRSARAKRSRGRGVDALLEREPQQRFRIHVDVLYLRGPMQMRTGDPAGFAHAADLLAALHCGSRFDLHFGEMEVSGEELSAVVNHHGV